MGKKTIKTLLFAVAALGILTEASVSCEAALVLKNKETAEAESESYAQRLKDAREQIENEEVGSYGMLPVYASDIEDGTYEIEVESSSSFFKITEAKLTVDGDEMTAEITISSLSYSDVYQGTAEEAQEDEDGWISAEEVDDKSVFTLSVTALDTPLDCAAFSKKKQLWYDRQLVFEASSLPEEALKITLPDYELIEDALLAYQADDADSETEYQTGAEGGQTESRISDKAEQTESQSDGQEEQKAAEPIEIDKPDGEYSIEVNMTGGSGRASISSPTLLKVEEGKAYARLLWSSSYYDYVILDGVTYYNQTTDGGNSRFIIPITVLDGPMTIIADTTAMGDPVEIEYTLTFYSDSIGTKGEIPQEAAKRVLVLGLAIIAVGGVLNHFIKIKRKYS